MKGKTSTAGPLAPLNAVSHSSSVLSDQLVLGASEADWDAWMGPAKLALKTLGIAPLPDTYHQPWRTVPEQAFEESNLTVPSFVSLPAVGDIHNSASSITGIPSMPHNYEGSTPHWVSKNATSSQRGCRLPAAPHELNIRKLQQRLILEGGDLGAIKLVERVFSKGVTMEALTRRLTREEAALHTFGYRAGPLYLAFLEPIEKANGALPCRYQCRLCPNDGKVLTWKHHRDVLRHLRKEHFGLGEKCRAWYVGHLQTGSGLTFVQWEASLHEERIEESPADLWRAVLPLLMTTRFQSAMLAALGLGVEDMRTSEYAILNYCA